MRHRSEQRPDSETPMVRSRHRMDPMRTENQDVSKTKFRQRQLVARVLVPTLIFVGAVWVWMELWPRFGDPCARDTASSNPAPSKSRCSSETVTSTFPLAAPSGCSGTVDPPRGVWLRSLSSAVARYALKPTSAGRVIRVGFGDETFQFGAFGRGRMNVDLSSSRLTSSRWFTFAT